MPHYAVGHDIGGLLVGKEKYDGNDQGKRRPSLSSMGTPHSTDP